jgi:hypothetical protein
VFRQELESHLKALNPVWPSRWSNRAEEDDSSLHAGYSPAGMIKAAHVQQAQFRFYAELNDLLSLRRRGRSFVHTFGVPPSLKDAIETFEVPHTEVGLILANGEAAAFSRPLRDGDSISVYPVFRSLDICSTCATAAPARRRDAFRA